MRDLKVGKDFKTIYPIESCTVGNIDNFWLKKNSQKKKKMKNDQNGAKIQKMGTNLDFLMSQKLPRFPTVIWLLTNCGL